MRAHLKPVVLVMCLASCLAACVPASATGQEGRKSLRKALLFSLMLPGAGEVYMGHTGRAEAMFAAEAGIWASFAYFRIQGDMREDSYKEIARMSAGVTREMDDFYYKMLAYYVSNEDFNVDIIRDARLRFPDDRAMQIEYFDEHAYLGDDAWQWDSLDRMNEYARIRTLSRQSDRRATLTTGFAVLNRMISMIDVYLSYKLGNDAGRSSKLGLGLAATPEGGVRLFLQAPF